jgi:hypothetical protein
VPQFLTSGRAPFPLGPATAGRAAAALLVAGLGLLTFAEAGWSHAIGVVALLLFIAVGFVAAAPGILAPEDDPV